MAKEKLMENEGKIHTITKLIIIFISVLYAVAMMQQGGNYDEVYSLRYYAYRGPMHVISYWGNTNNHIFMNLLNSFVWIITKNPVLSARLFSLLFFISTLILLTYWMTRTFSQNAAIVSVITFAFSGYARRFGALGRGYSISMFCFALAVVVASMLVSTIEKTKALKLYIFWGICIAMAVYTVPTNIYWIIPIASYLVVQFFVRKSYRNILYICLSSISAALVVIALYTNIWYHIAMSNGYQAAVWEQIKYGFNSMMSNQIIKKLPREQFWLGFKGWFSSIGNSTVLELGLTGMIVLSLLLGAGMILIVCMKKGDILNVNDSARYTMEICVVTFFGTVFIVLIQGVLPFERIFCYFSVILSISLGTLFFELNGLAAKEIHNFLVRIAFVSVGVVFIYKYFIVIFPGAGGNGGVSGFLYNNIIDNPDQSYYIGDEITYLSYFFYGGKDGNTVDYDSEVPDVVILRNEQTKKGYVREWPCYCGYDNLDWEGIEALDIVYKDSTHTVFQRSQE